MKKKLCDFVDMVDSTDGIKIKRPELPKPNNLTRLFSHGL